jgi:ABC-type phosphate transport system ATPase subunit
MLMGKVVEHQATKELFATPDKKRDAGFIISISLCRNYN